VVIRNVRPSNDVQPNTTACTNSLTHSIEQHVYYYNYLIEIISDRSRKWDLVDLFRVRFLQAMLTVRSYALVSSEHYSFRKSLTFECIQYAGEIIETTITPAATEVKIASVVFEICNRNDGTIIMCEQVECV